MIQPIETLPDSSRVWVYQASEPFDAETAARIATAAAAFAGQWTAHDTALKAGVAVVYNTFLVFAVDESHAGASGCSMDKKVRFVRELETTFGLNFFDRMRIAWRDGSVIRVSPFVEFGERIQNGSVSDETRVFNNLVQTLGEWKSGWEIPLGSSWHKNLLVTG